jgi:LPS export ABC transporter protein LptC
MKNKICFLSIFIILMIPMMVSCSFDYGESDGTSDDQPDLIMENVEYVRVRSADPIARFQAERAERYEKQGLMKLQNFMFEQYGNKGNDVNALGRAGNAEIGINSGDILMNRGVRVEVESEDIILETYQLEWKDEPRIITTGENNIVTISQENGTSFSGLGLNADARRRTWEFAGSVSGTFVIEDDDEEDALQSGDELEE